MVVTFVYAWTPFGHGDGTLMSLTRWIEKELKPWVIEPWERRFFANFERTAGDCAVSMGRGNGKSAAVSAIACAVLHPNGPLHGRRAQAICVAPSFPQSKIIFEDCLEMMEQATGGLDRATWRVLDSGSVALLEHRDSKARIRCIGGKPATGHGHRPKIALLDEPAQWDRSKGERMLAAIKTGLGKVEGSRMIALGTRPASADHWFEKMLKGIGVEFATVFSASEKDSATAWRSILKANPSLRGGRFRSLALRIKRELEDAKMDPGLMQSFKALRLNQGCSDIEVAVLLDAGLWDEIEGEDEMSPPLIWGVDLGTSSAQSAVSCYSPKTGALECVAAFPELPNLYERGLADGVGDQYRRCYQRGELILAGRRAVDLHILLDEALDRWGRPSVVVADRWREAELTDALEKAKIPPARLVRRGMGFKDGAEDVRSFRRACAEGKVIPKQSLLLWTAMAEARVISDPAGNQKLAKNAQGGRRLRAKDDCASAGILAVAEGTRTSSSKRPSWRTALAG